MKIRLQLANLCFSLVHQWFLFVVGLLQTRDLFQEAGWTWSEFNTELWVDLLWVWKLRFWFQSRGNELVQSTLRDYFLRDDWHLQIPDWLFFLLVTHLFIWSQLLLNRNKFLFSFTWHFDRSPLEFVTVTFSHDWGLRVFTVIGSEGLAKKRPTEDVQY